MAYVMVIIAGEERRSCGELANLSFQPACDKIGKSISVLEENR